MVLTFLRQNNFHFQTRDLNMEDVQKGCVEPWVAWIPTLGLSQVDDLANSVHRGIVHLRFDLSTISVFPHHLDFQRGETRGASDLSAGVDASCDVQLHVEVAHQRVHPEKVRCDGKLVLFQP